MTSQEEKDRYKTSEDNWMRGGDLYDIHDSYEILVILYMSY